MIKGVTIIRLSSLVVVSYKVAYSKDIRGLDQRITHVVSLAILLPIYLQASKPDAGTKTSASFVSTVLKQTQVQKVREA